MPHCHQQLQSCQRLWLKPLILTCTGHFWWWEDENENLIDSQVDSTMTNESSIDCDKNDKTEQGSTPVTCPQNIIMHASSPKNCKMTMNWV
ncbi:hypothetical protein VP01_1004g10 [Puccinia sorghi]|uniref:Uncharacterized protein n=1 Tax=Puccinia sorghi TaxID=27349 RepID=A0A0L6VVP7_9BASI|nr:hypothetical protein VP01_1004g10 [Puccinia sorghi]